MKFSSLTLIVSEDCNSNCVYCYKKREKIYLDFKTARKALVFFYPFSKKIFI